MPITAEYESHDGAPLHDFLVAMRRSFQSLMFLCVPLCPLWFQELDVESTVRFS